VEVVGRHPDHRSGDARRLDSGSVRERHLATHLHRNGVFVMSLLNSFRASSWSRRGAVVGAGIVAVAGAGVAFAAWTNTGAGNAGAKAASFSALTITAPASAGGTLLYPGLTADGSTAGGDVTVVVTNPNPFPVTVTGVAQDTSAGKFVS